ncbi:hypothetical protein H8356DRAFT_1360666 [Neocallimastix lanati (nom. inval.)]|nr:hypothetical protein H8356DRAFT_1360666 [Neocallimastix sp. JGI-2020a]
MSETNRGKEQIIIDRKFKYNFSKLKNDNTKIYRFFIILNDNKEVLNYESSHNHLDEIKSLIPDKKSKRIFDKISQEIGYLLRGECFMIFKNSNIIIFQSPFQAKLFMENKHIFDDGTFLIAPTNSYQVFITRTCYRIIVFILLPYMNLPQIMLQNLNKSISHYEYQIKIRGIWRKKRRISERVDEINILVEYYKNIEAELKNIGCCKNDIIENWFNCLVRLNNKIINFN